MYEYIFGYSIFAILRLYVWLKDHPTAFFLEHFEVKWRSYELCLQFTLILITLGQWPKVRNCPMYKPQFKCPISVCTQ